MIRTNWSLASPPAIKVFHVKHTGARAPNVSRGTYSRGDAETSSFPRGEGSAGYFLVLKNTRFNPSCGKFKTSRRIPGAIGPDSVSGGGPDAITTPPGLT